jgi:probable HAF family extracellular repeat protein
VVGYSNLAGDQFYHGFLWEHGAFKDLPPASGGDYSWALWINDLGDVSGGSTLPGDQLNHASLWGFGKSSDLGTVGQDPCSEALSVNDLQQIVGASYPCSNEQAGRAFLWENGGPMVDLNALVENPSDLYLYIGTYINDSGEIVAQVVLPNGDFHAAPARSRWRLQGRLRTANPCEPEGSSRACKRRLDESGVWQRSEVVAQSAGTALRSARPALILASNQHSAARCLGGFSLHHADGSCVTSVIRRYPNFAPFVRQTGERKAQACANGMFRQLPVRSSVSEFLRVIAMTCVSPSSNAGPSNIGCKQRCQGEVLFVVP